jgi:hypothetical protein
MKKFGFAAFCLLLSAVVLPLTSAFATEAPVSPALCLGSGGAEIVFKTNDTSCPASRCIDDDQCWEHCTQAISASCVAGACQYTLPGGGGGTGSGGQCPYQSHCIDDTQCDYPLFGVQGTCSAGTCHC